MNVKSMLATVAGVAVATAVATGVLTVTSNERHTGAQNAVTLAASSSVDGVVFWGHRVDDNPRDFVSRTQLAASLLARARARHNTTDAIAADVEIDKVLRVVPNDRSAMLVKADARMFVHDFAAGRAYGLRLFARDRTDKSALALLGDAYFELGDLTSAATMYQRLVARVPNSPEAFARLARLANAHGDHAAALASARTAIVQANAQQFTPTATTYYLFLLGELERGIGRYDDAAATFERVLSINPIDGRAIEALGKVEAARGNLDAAARWWQRSGALIGIPDFHVNAALGDIEFARGNATSARRYWQAALDAVAALPLEQRIGFVRDESHLRATHHLDVKEALRLARDDLGRRQDAFAYDTLAWAQLAAGDARQARASIEHALATGVDDASVWYHAAEIYAATGATGKARTAVHRALTLSPQFDLYDAAQARALAARLG